MKSNIAISKILIKLSSLGIILGGIVGVLLSLYLPAYYSDAYPYIIIGFIIFESALVYMVKYLSTKVSAVRLAQVYMAIMIAKLLLSFGVIGCYILINGKEEVKPFAINFAIIYILFLILESRAFVQFEQHLKQEKHNEQK